MYNYIRDPKNNRKISVTSKRGKYILKKYLDFFLGGTNTEERFMTAPEEQPEEQPERFYTALNEHEHPRNNDGEMQRVHADEVDDDPDAPPPPPPKDKADIYDLDPDDDERVQQYLDEKNLILVKRPGDLNCKKLFSEYNPDKNCIEDVISQVCIDKTDLMHFPNADRCGSRKSMCRWYHDMNRLYFPTNPNIEESREWWEEQCQLLLDYNNLDNRTIRIAVKKYLENPLWDGPPINEWGTSEVTDMRFLFRQAHYFNDNISNWDTSNVDNMMGMFAEARSFNQSLNWNTSNVKCMVTMFYEARNFNQRLNFTDTSTVEDMHLMFYKATSFDQPLEWNTSSVKNMSEMFRGASSFNQQLDWDIRSVIDMHNMFNDAVNFGSGRHEPLGLRNTNSVKNMANLFKGAISFNQPLIWDTSNVENMNAMFMGAINFNQPLDWNIDKVKYMSFMFKGATNFNQPLDWDLSRVEDKEEMFDE